MRGGTLSLDPDERPPTFSVVIPTYNRSALLRRALASVRRQSFQDFEVVVVDDGSEEDIATVVAEEYPRARCVRLARNSGIPAARNAGIASARGDFVAFLDSDDVWHPRYLQYQHAVSNAVPKAIFTFADYYSDGPRFSGPVRQLDPAPSAENAVLQMLLRPFVHTMSCFVAPRSSIYLIGGFDERCRRFEDVDLYVRLLAGRRGRGRLACLDRPAPNIPQILVLKTIHVADRTIAAYAAEWDETRRAFLDIVFSYEFMAPYQHLRSACEEGLLRGQQEFFENFADC